LRGIDFLEEAIKVAPKDAAERLKSSLNGYVDRAGEMRKKFEVKVEAVKKIVIREDSTGYSYEKVFDFCLKTPFAEVEVEDPWIQSPHQLHAFVAFCELVVVKSPSLKKIILRTQAKEDRQKESLAEIGTSLRLHGVELQVKFGTFHDREIRFSNGWTCKSGRGLDIYKGVTRFSLFNWDLNRRKCKETTIDIYRRVN